MREGREGERERAEGGKGFGEPQRLENTSIPLSNFAEQTDEPAAVQVRPSRPVKPGPAESRTLKTNIHYLFQHESILPDIHLVANDLYILLFYFIFSIKTQTHFVYGNIWGDATGNFIVFTVKK